MIAQGRQEAPGGATGRFRIQLNTASFANKIRPSDLGAPTLQILLDILFTDKINLKFWFCGFSHKIQNLKIYLFVTGIQNLKIKFFIQKIESCRSELRAPSCIT